MLNPRIRTETAVLPKLSPLLTQTTKHAVGLDLFDVPIRPQRRGSLLRIAPARFVDRGVRVGRQVVESPSMGRRRRRRRGRAREGRRVVGDGRVVEVGRRRRGASPTKRVSATALPRVMGRGSSRTMSFAKIVMLMMVVARLGRRGVGRRRRSQRYQLVARPRERGCPRDLGLWYGGASGMVRSLAKKRRLRGEYVRRRLLHSVHGDH